MNELIYTFVALLQGIFVLELILSFYSLQRGQKLSVRATETASRVRRSSVHGVRDLPLDSTSLHVMRTVPMNPCSATAARDTAGAWTGTGRRSLGLALGLAADQCVSTSHVFNA